MVRNTSQATSAIPAETSSTDHAGTTRGRPDETRPEDQTRKTTEQTERRGSPAATMPMKRHPKDLTSLRIDHDVVEWFRTQGPGYQTRMNSVLRAYMEHVRGTHAEGDP